MKTTKRLIVTYPGNLYPAADAFIEKCVGAEADGAGIGMGERDMEFTVPASLAETLRTRLQDLAKAIPGIVVEVE